MWRYNRSSLQWELVDLDGNVKGRIALELIYDVPQDQQLRFTHMVREQFGCALPMRAFDFRTA